MKKLISLILAALLALSIMTAVAEVSKGAKGDEVKEIQQILSDLGYLTGKVDGDFGGGTEKAVKAFQAAEGLEETGVVDDGTMERLRQKQKEHAEAKRLEEADQLASALQAEYEKDEKAFREDTLTKELRAFKTENNVGVFAYTHSFPKDIVGTTLIICPPADWSYVTNDSKFTVITANYDTVSWTKERSFYDYMYEYQYAGEKVEQGITSFTHLNSTQLTDTGFLFYLWIDLPNDASIAGNQTLTISDKDHNYSTTLELNLEYLGDGNGWSVDLLGSRPALPEELFIVESAESEAQ